MGFEISGAGLKDPMNQAVTYIDKMITIPVFAHLYYEHQDLPFTYHEVLTLGEVDEEKSSFYQLILQSLLAFLCWLMLNSMMIPYTLSLILVH